jgi:hypothetical protein
MAKLYKVLITVVIVIIYIKGEENIVIVMSTYTLHVKTEIQDANDSETDCTGIQLDA